MPISSTRPAVWLPAISLFALSLAPRPASSADWWVVDGPHFIVRSDAGENKARLIARELESIRAVFSLALPNLPSSSGPPLEVFAAKNGKSLEALLPEVFARDRSGPPGGMFLRSAHQSFVLLDTAARGDAPYTVVYHEYFHSLMLPAVPKAPLWFHEGLAGVWESTVTGPKRVEMARPNDLYLEVLRNASLIPLGELVSADRTSPYYRGQHRTTLFYAEAWALMHYILLGEETRKRRDSIGDYLSALERGMEGKAAFETAFGGLDETEEELRQYVRKLRFTALRMAKPPELDDGAFSVRPLDETERRAELSHYFALVGNRAAARENAEAALARDPRNATAHEALGVAAYSDGRLTEAASSFEKAATNDGTRFLPHFFLALLTPETLPPDERAKSIQAELERAVTLNPWHGPSLARLAMLYHADPEKRSIGFGMAERAAALLRDDPFAQTAYGVSLREQGRLEDAIRAFELALDLDPDFELARSELARTRSLVGW